VKQDQKIF